MRVFCRIALLVAMTAGLSSGGPITFVYNGIVTAVGVDELYMDIAAGDPFQLSFVFDSTAADLIPSDSSAASYLSVGVPFSAVLTLPTHVFVAADSVSIGVLNSSFIDQYTLYAQGSAGAIILEILLQDNSATVFANDSLPLVTPVVSAFTIADFHFRQVGELGEVQVDGQLTSAVPEPSTVLSFFVGAAVICILSRLKILKSVRR